MSSPTTTSRLRRAFRYPADSDSDSPTEMDEDQQDQLIASLEAYDAKQNALYRYAFLAIPLLAALYTLVAIFFPSPSPSSNGHHLLLALLSISSLLATAYILHSHPITAPARKGKRAMYQVEAEQGPLDRYIVPLNAALAGVTLLAALVSWRQRRMEAVWRESLPAIVFALGMFARWQLAPVDFEELRRARYGLKGA